MLFSRKNQACLQACDQLKAILSHIGLMNGLRFCRCNRRPAHPWKGGFQMATIRTSSDGVLFDFSHDEVINLEEAEDITLKAVPLLTAAWGGAVALGWIPKEVGIIGTVVIAGVAATIGIHRIEFQQADKGNGVEVTLPWWAVVLGWWGALFMKSLPHNQSVGPGTRVACTTNAEGDLHVCAIDAQGGLYHTIRRPDGTWPFAFGDVQAETKLVGSGIGRTPYVACATNAQGDLHVCAIDAQGGLFHTIRRPDGTWPFAFGDVQAETSLVGPGIGRTPYVACATNSQGDLHVCAIDAQGGLWHTIRRPDGTWPFAFGDVQAQTRLVGPNPGIGPTPHIACATNSAGDLHVCAVNAHGGLFHTIRRPDGTWPFAFGDVNAEVGGLP
jgi:hypothetical protein